MQHLDSVGSFLEVFVCSGTTGDEYDLVYELLVEDLCGHESMSDGRRVIGTS